MAVQFDITGKLSLPKETEKFKNFETKEYASGWINKVLKFNCVAGDNRFMLQSKGGYFSDGSSKIYLFSKDSVKDDGSKVKGEAFTISWKERLTHPRLAEVVEWKKFIVDLEESGFRRDLRFALNNVKEGKTLTEEEVARFGAADVKGLEKALEESNKKRKEFVAEADFVDFMYKVLNSDKYKNKKFRVMGNYDMQYSDANNRFYCSYVPNRIYLADDDAEEVATANTVLFFDGNSLVDAKANKNKYFVNGYVQQYDSARKENIFAPYTIVIHGAKDDSDLEKKREKVVVKRFTVEDESVYEYGVVLNLLDGAQRETIKFEDLTEEQQDSILLGELTLADIQREVGGVYGERVTENVFVKPARGYSKGREITAYTSDMLTVKAVEDDDTNVFEDTESDEVDSLFDEDDDLFN